MSWFIARENPFGVRKPIDGGIYATKAEAKTALWVRTLECATAEQAARLSILDADHDPGRTIIQRGGDMAAPGWRPIPVNRR